MSAERDDGGALHGQGVYPRNCGEVGHELVVGQAAQDVRVQAAVRHALGEVAECADLPPREPGLAELAGIDAQQVGGCGEMAAEQGRAGTFSLQDWVRPKLVAIKVSGCHLILVICVVG